MTPSLSPTMTLLLDRQVQFELRRQLLLAVQSVGEIHPPYPTIGMDLHPQCLNIIGAIRSPGEVGKIELDLVPSLVQSHWHCADEWFDSGGGLIIACSEPSPHILVIKDLDLKGEIFLHVLDNHDEVGQLDAQGLLWVGGTGDVGGADVGPHNLQHKALDVLVCDPLDVSIPHFLVPDLERFGANTVENAQEATLECVLKHDSCGFYI